MKAIGLVLAGLLVAPMGTFAQAPAASFGLTTNSALVSDASVLRTMTRKVSSPGQFMIDTQSEDRGSRPIVACTLFSYKTAFTDVSVQPLLGRINGAQLKVNW